MKQAIATYLPWLLSVLTIYSAVLAGDKEMQHDREFDRIGLVKQMLARTAEPI